MNSDLLKYLQGDGIGKVIARGLADVYTNKPQAPVKYLAAWLKTYSRNQKEIENLSTEETTKMWKLKQHNMRMQESDTKVAAKKQEDSKAAKELQSFKEKVQKDEYQKQLLFHELPEFIEKRLQLTGTYIGYVKHPPKEITDEDEDDNAHLNTSEPKMINYIGSSTSHSELMLGKTLALDKGVTGGAFALSLDDPQPNEQGVIEAKDKYVYIPKVQKNENMTYFRLPKLGAYIAVPLVYQSYLTQNIFNVALEAREKYLADLNDFQNAKVQALKEIETELEAADQKLADAKQKSDEAAIQAANSELAEINTKKREKEAEKFDEQKTQLPTQKKEFVICADTIGKDTEISLDKRELLVELARHFRDSWQKMQKDLLYKDVVYQISIKKDNEVPPETVIENIEKCIEIPAQTKTTFDEIEDEQLRQYKKNSWQLQALKKEIKEGQQYLAAFFKLKNFRVVKFRNLIQTILYFLKYEKKTINQPNKTRLDWKKVRANYLYAETFNAILNYNSEGPKTEDYPFYCKLNHISQKLQKYSEADIYNYNIGLGAVVTLIKKEIAHRIANIELRRAQKDKERQQRDQVIEENEKMNEEKKQALEKHKQSLSGQDLEAFKEQEWSSKYDEENPLKEVPPEVIDDIDNDF